MEPKNDLKEPEITVENLDGETTASVDDFIKELEAKEKDLHITADYQIEIEESEVGQVPESLMQELQESTASDRETRQARAAQSQLSEPGLKTRVYELEKEVEKLEARIKELRTERNEIQEKSDRRLKDFENYRYRVDRERRGATIEQIATLAGQMLPVIDNLDRALTSAREVPEKKRSEFKQFFEGLWLVHTQINEVFGGMGVEPIRTVGEIFDPNFHEAVAVEEHDDRPVNTILEELLRGYRIGNRVIRHSMVKVTAAPRRSKPLSQQMPEEVPEASPETSIEIAAPAPEPVGNLPSDEPSQETE